MQLLKAAALVGAGVLASATLSWARSSDTGQVHACTSGAGQPILLGNSDGTCPTGTPLSWGLQGPAGPAGPAGRAGAQGAAGAPGPSGVQTLVLVTKSSPAGRATQGAIATASATCPAGFVAISGGYRVVGDLQRTKVWRNGPVRSGSRAVGWSAAGIAGKGQHTWSIEATAVCTKR